MKALHKLLAGAVALTLAGTGILIANTEVEDDVRITSKERDLSQFLRSTSASSGPVIAYTELDCEGEATTFASYRALKIHLQTYGGYYSYVPEHGTDQCINFVTISLVTGMCFPNYSFNPPSGAPIFQAMFFSLVWNHVIKNANECWQEKADAAGVDYDDTGYEVVVNFGGTFALGHTFPEMGNGTIVIYKPALDMVTAPGTPFYPILIQTLVHEWIHSERIESNSENPNPFLEEREVQQLAYERFVAIYGIEPPRKYRTLKQLQTLLDDSYSFLGSKGTQIEEKTYEEVEDHIEDLLEKFDDPDYEFTQAEALEMLDYIEMRDYLSAFFRAGVENKAYNGEMIPQCD
ncbi:MAG: hypothetical protein OXH31_02405 [Gammaproteobacteria bacterium]|nr:hypothetical protein [Gammaproteobacteria bacterium]